MEKNCQSCGMPMGETAELFGTNADGSKSIDYCYYCYENGEFTEPECTMEEMIEAVWLLMEEHGSEMTETKARQWMSEMFPTFKRWKKS